MRYWWESEGNSILRPPTTTYRVTGVKIKKVRLGLVGMDRVRLPVSPVVATIGGDGGPCPNPLTADMVNSYWVYGLSGRIV